MPGISRERGGVRAWGGRGGGVGQEISEVAAQTLGG